MSAINLLSTQEHIKTDIYKIWFLLHVDSVQCPELYLNNNKVFFDFIKKSPIANSPHYTNDMVTIKRLMKKNKIELHELLEINMNFRFVPLYSGAGHPVFCGFENSISFGYGDIMYCIEGKEINQLYKKMRKMMLRKFSKVELLVYGLDEILC